MPYLTNERIVACDKPGHIPESSGELNYMVTSLIIKYVKEHGESYSVFNDVTGALTSANAEFYRRVVAPYEDMKKEVNGDVYESFVDRFLLGT